MKEIILVMTNLPDQATARLVAQKLLESRLVACANILASCTSLYHWQGNIEQADEVPLLLKTTRDAYPALEKLLRELHPYELPEIIAVPVVAGLAEYLGWVEKEACSG
jgi:periplasmic divalent cation tolerance protein